MTTRWKLLTALGISVLLAPVTGYPQELRVWHVGMLGTEYFVPSSAFSALNAGPSELFSLLPKDNALAPAPERECTAPARLTTAYCEARTPYLVLGTKD